MTRSDVVEEALSRRVHLLEVSAHFSGGEVAAACGYRRPWAGSRYWYDPDDPGTWWFRTGLEVRVLKGVFGGYRLPLEQLCPGCKRRNDELQRGPA